MQEEIWKDIPGYEGYYQASSLGRVKGLDRKVKRKDKYINLKSVTLKLQMGSTGCQIVCLRKDGKRKTFKVHQLVAMAFLNHKRCGFELVVNHINFNRLDNRVVNLEIVSSRENTNRKHLPSSSRYTGVNWEKQREKWRAEIRIGKKGIFLGRYVDEYEAHLAYEKALDNILNDRPPKHNWNA